MSEDKYEIYFGKLEEIINGQELDGQQMLIRCYLYFKQECVTRDDIEKMLEIKNDPKWNSIIDCIIHSFLQSIYGSYTFTGLVEHRLKK